jgi:hypothetical protein
MSPAKFSIGLLVVVFTVLTSGCASSLHFTSAKAQSAFHDADRPVFVVNPGLAREFAILKKSGIYVLSGTAEGSRRLTLRPMVQHGRCGNSLMLSILTFGIVPGYLSADMDFEYELEDAGVSKRVRHRLALHARYSIWDRLAPEDAIDVMSEALRFSSPGVVQSLAKSIQAESRRPPS